MAMREWPGEVDVQVKYLPQDEKGNPTAADFQTLEVKLVVKGRCADHVLQKIKDHYRAKLGNSCYFQIGRVDWIMRDKVEGVVVDF